jgi:hypothetical protein
MHKYLCTILFIITFYVSSAQACLSYSSDKYRDPLVMAWVKINTAYELGYENAKSHRDVIYSAMNSRQKAIVNQHISMNNY